MSASDYTDIFARFSDRAAAENLADYIADAGFACDVVELSGLSSDLVSLYGVRVARQLIADLKEALALTPIANYADPLSPQVVAGRLARETIPCYVGGLPVTGVGPYGIGNSGVPIDDDGKLGLYTLAVPARFVEAAEVILKDHISEGELEKLALDDSGNVS